MKKSIIGIGAIVLAVLLPALMMDCGGEGCTTKHVKDSINSSEEKEPEPLNISVYLDLSDRLEKEMSPSQMERDTAIVGHLVDKFITDCITNGKIVNSRNHFQIFFYPAPTNSEIAALAKGLNVDMSKLQPQEKKKELAGMKKRFQDNLAQIYGDAVNQHKYVGSDIWGFFSNKQVDALCVRKGYRNILVILTDGYLYYQDNKVIEGEAYSYILPLTLAQPNSSLIVKRNGLENLEVLMLEVNPYSPKEHEKLVSVLEAWFSGMGITKFVVRDTDLPVNTETFIDTFIDN